MKRHEFIQLTCSSIFLLLLAGFIFYYSHKVSIPNNDIRYEKLISKRERTVITEADHEILKIAKLASEVEKLDRELNSNLVAAIFSISGTLVCVSIFQFLVLFSIHKSRKHTEPLDIL